jgi:hypothetical protein
MFPWCRAAAGIGVLLGVPILATVGVTGLAAQSLTYDGSVSWSRGSYIFTQPTHSFWLSNGLSLQVGRLSLSASLPVIVQNSGIISFVAGQPVPTGGEDSGAVGRRNKGEPVGTRGPSADARVSGQGGKAAQAPEADSATVLHRDAYEVQVGDPLLSGSVEVYSGLGFLRALSAGLYAKAPIRSVESGVGTGAWDVGSGASLVAGAGRNLFLADVSYWSFGDLPDLELESGLMWGLSVSRSFREGRAALSASLAGASAMAETMDGPLSVGAGLMVLPRSGRAVSAGLWFGLTESAPDLSVALTWSVRLTG